MRQSLFSPLLVLTFCICAVGAEPGIPSWLRGRSASTSSIQDTSYCVSVYKASLSDLALVSFAPDGQRYAILTSSPTSQVVEIQSLEDGRSVSVYMNGTMRDNHFSPLGLLWAPDSDRLFVKFGYGDIGNGFWFPHDVASGEMTGDQELFHRVASSPIAQRTDPLCQDGPQPVWTIGGKEFENEHAARSAGHSALFSPRVLRENPESVAHVQWVDGKRYSIFVDPRDQHWLAHIIVDGELIDSIRVVAPMYQQVLFADEGGRLVAKLLPQEGRTSGPLTVDFGLRRLERVTDLGQAGLLVQSRDVTYRYWQILDPKVVAPSQQ